MLQMHNKNFVTELTISSTNRNNKNYISVIHTLFNKKPHTHFNVGFAIDKRTSMISLINFENKHCPLIMAPTMYLSINESLNWSKASKVLLQLISTKDKDSVAFHIQSIFKALY